MDDLLAATAADRHFALRLFAVFGVAAIVLAAIGIMGCWQPVSPNVVAKSACGPRWARLARGSWG